VEPSARTLIEHFGMTQLPVEETFFAGTYQSAAETPAGGPVGTAMVGLHSVDPPSRSLFHRLAFDEVWHFYLGDPIRLVLLHTDGSSQDVIMGNDVVAGQQVQFVVGAGTWQAGELVDGGRWALFGCTMAPGFTGACFEGGRISQLLATHPDRDDDIRRLGLQDGHATGMPDSFGERLETAG
jgi:predicted cupin superfamily sugar epimerase